MKTKYYARKRKIRRVAHKRFYIIVGALAAALVVGVFFIVMAVLGQPGTSDRPGESVAIVTPSETPTETPTETPAETPTETPTPPTPTPVPTLAADLAPAPTDNGTVNTDPSAFKFKTDIRVGDNDVSSYLREEPISFGSGDEYTDLEGVITFRGNNYRNAPNWGTASVTEGKLKKMLQKQTGSTGKWAGSAWTGQPLVVKWPEQTRKNMKTLYPDFRSKPDFTEVILASVDGNIYFMDAETGAKTRNFIRLRAPTKGTASLDPRGYPMLYVGQGLQSDGDATKCANMAYRAVNLITGEVKTLWTYQRKDPFAYRGWQAYDSSALIDAKTDTLIEPGENGIIYTVKLNTKYDENAGTLTINPDKPVKYRYSTPANESRDKKNAGRWGIENSAAAWRNYLFFTDNAGLLQCLDLNTMKLVYANDMGNDSDVSMVLEEDPANQKFYLYTGCEYDDEVANKQPGKGPTYARKIDGLTGQIIWEQQFTADSSNRAVDGGILASPVLGKEGTSLEGLIIYNVCDEVKGDSTTSELVAMDKLTGDIKWRYDMEVTGWSPSSPVPVYTDDGQGYIVQCDREGNVALIKADATGAVVADKLALAVKGQDGKVAVQNNFEATPVVYGNMIVVASRSGYIFFIKIT